MTDREFQHRVTALGLTSHCLPAARDVLVEGHSRNAAAREHGVDLGQLSRLCKRLREVTLCRECGQAR